MQPNIKRVSLSDHDKFRIEQILEYWYGEDNYIKNEFTAHKAILDVTVLQAKDVGRRASSITS